MATPSVGLGSLIRYFAWLGTTGFGGPVLLVERMRRDLQEMRGWYTAAEYKEGLALAQLAPGPLAAQLAIYLGWVRAGLPGATVVGTSFIAPSFVMVLALSAAYVRYGGLPWMQGAFYGIGAAVISIITPGPVVITVAFIGYLVAGPLGAGAAAIGVFLPVYVVVVVVARWFHAIAQNRPLKAMIDGVTAAATGAIMGATFVLGQRAL